MEREYKLKSKMLDAVTDRMNLVFNDKIEAEQELKTVSARVTLDDFEKIGNLSSMLQMSKSDFLRMIIVNACDDIIREYKINFESFGMTHAETDDLIEKLNSGEVEIVDKGSEK